MQDGPLYLLVGAMALGIRQFLTYEEFLTQRDDAHPHPRVVEYAPDAKITQNVKGYTGLYNFYSSLPFVLISLKIYFTSEKSFVHCFWPTTAIRDPLATKALSDPRIERDQ